MDTEKKVGRPRKVVQQEGSPIEQRDGCNWLSLTAAILAEKRQVSRCWHPEPQAELVMLTNGSNVAVLSGDASYQLTTGEVVKDF